ncbi:MAG: hypothetical protein EZS28_049557, partial [Streblomastix strix]
KKKQEKPKKKRKRKLGEDEEEEEEDTQNEKFVDDGEQDDEDDDDDDDGERESISSVVHVEMRMVPIFPTRLGLLPSIKLRKLFNAEEMRLLHQKISIINIHLKHYVNKIIFQY